MSTINRMLTRREQASLLFVGVALILGVVSVWWYRGDPAGDSSRVTDISSRRSEQAVRAIDAAPASAVPARPAEVWIVRASTAEHGAASEAKPLAGHPGDTAEAVGALPTPQQPGVSADAGSDERPREVAVAVRGGVIREGLYRLASDSRVADLIEKAGGARSGANLTMINLAAPLVDGTTLTIPLYPEEARERGAETPEQMAFLVNPMNPSCYLITAQPDRAGPPEVSEDSGHGLFHETESRGAVMREPLPGPDAGGTSRLNLNTATQAELEQLPGIGPKLAQQIILYRSRQAFTSVEDLDAVPGFGPKRIEAIRDLVTAP